MSTSTAEPQPHIHENESTPIAPGADDVHNAIRNLLADEYPDLATNHGDQVNREPYLELRTKTVVRYFKFMFQTWSGVASSFVRMLSFEISPYRFWELLISSILITVVLTVGVIVCIVAKVPAIRRAFQRHSNIWHGGVGIVNIINNKMFGQLSKEETDAARRALAASESAEHKEFNLDIAKLLLLFASIMYERTSVTKQGAIKEAVSRQHMRLNPHRPGHARLRHFPGPGDLIQDVFGRAGLIDIKQALKRSSHVSRIQEFARQMEIEFEPVSELNSMSSAYSALFWDVNSNWIVVAFKGTSPTEFDEWITDFDFTRVPAGKELPGYGKIHRGFKERVFPEKSTSSRSPYETIVRGVDIVSRDLIERLQRKGETTEINVYFTGHSLGCATSTLAYVGMIDEVTLDPRVRIRDAYLFAAPVLCDMPSVRVFNQRMARNPDKPKTMWRIVNGNDVVAVGLPSLGDRPTFKYPDSIFAFAHLGIELQMRKKPVKSSVSDYYATVMTSGAVLQPTPQARVVSEMDPNLIGVIPRGEKLPVWKEMLQHLPISGRLFAHFPGFYWEALQLMGTGDAHWNLHWTDSIPRALNW